MFILSWTFMILRRAFQLRQSVFPITSKLFALNHGVHQNTNVNFLLFFACSYPWLWFDLNGFTRAIVVWYINFKGKLALEPNLLSRRNKYRAVKVVLNFKDLSDITYSPIKIKEAQIFTQYENILNATSSYIQMPLYLHFV